MFGGGTWKRITDAFIYATTDNTVVEPTRYSFQGGKDKILLTAENLPNHELDVSVKGGNHKHSNLSYVFGAGGGGVPNALCLVGADCSIYTEYSGELSMSGKAKYINHAQQNIQTKPKYLNRYCWQRTE